ncbi:MAG: hypothetical protein H7Y11_04095, partial [Armatimonadetes bacterium]|nr:hypothetical protein [Anaerolineae bacterium]
MKHMLSTLILLLCCFVIYPTITVLAQGTVLADTGFRPQQHGFSFANYGNETNPVNLTPQTMQKVFGDTVCKAIQAGACVLTASSQAWMTQRNEEMEGGHCEGMAALSKL